MISRTAKREGFQALGRRSYIKVPSNPNDSDKHTETIQIKIKTYSKAAS